MEQVRALLDARKISYADMQHRTEYLLQTCSFVPGPTVKYRQVAGISTDLAIAVKAHGPLLVRADSPSGRIELQWQSDSIVPQPLPIHPQPYCLPLGMTASGTHRQLYLPKCPHILVAGTSGSGKSYWMHNAVMWGISQNLLVEIFDPKYSEFADLAALPRVTHSADPAAVLERTVELLSCMDGRYRYLAEIGLTDAVSAMGEGHMITPILLMVDEYADLVSRLGDAWSSQIQQLAQKGRAAGIHIVLGTQAPTAKLLNSELKANLPVRVSFKTASAVASRVILEESGAENLSGAGDGLAIDESGKLVRFRGYSKPIFSVTAPQYDIFDRMVK